MKRILKAIRRFFGIQTREEKLLTALERHKLELLEKQARDLKNTFPKDIPNPLK